MLEQNKNLYASEVKKKIFSAEKKSIRSQFILYFIVYLQEHMSCHWFPP